MGIKIKYHDRPAPEVCAVVYRVERVKTRKRRQDTLESQHTEKQYRTGDSVKSSRAIGMPGGLRKHIERQAIERAIGDVVTLLDGGPGTARIARRAYTGSAKSRDLALERLGMARIRLDHRLYVRRNEVAREHRWA